MHFWYNLALDFNKVMTSSNISGETKLIIVEGKLAIVPI